MNDKEDILDFDEDCSEVCTGHPFNCTVCSRMNEPYDYDENGQIIYKDLFKRRK